MLGSIAMEKHYIKFLNDITWEELFEKYGGQWVNHYNGKIISHNSDLQKANQEAIKILKHKNYTGLYVKAEWGRKICLPIYFKTVDVHPWKPFYEVKISLDNEIFDKQNMLIDSGADISVISKIYGEQLGLTLAPHEKIFSANGVGGGVLKFVEREIIFKFNNNDGIKAPVAWIQDDRYSEMIIGREVVFDKFDIEFKQAEEEIIFKYRRDD